MYKKYITKRGKKLGPYYYDSIRLKNGKVKSVYLGSDLKKAGQKLKVLKKESSKSVHKRSSATLKKTLNPRTHLILIKDHDVHMKDRIFLSFVLITMLVGFMHFGGILNVDNSNDISGGFAIEFKTFSDIAREGFEDGIPITGNVVSEGNKITGDFIFSEAKPVEEGEHKISLLVSESSEYSLNFNGIEKLKSLKLSGRTASFEEGVAKIFLSDVDSGDTYLVYDSESNDESFFDSIGITGNAVLEDPVENIKNYKEIASLLTGFNVIDSRGKKVKYESLNGSNGTAVVELDDFIEIEYPEKEGWFAYEEYSSRGLIEPNNISFERVFGFDFSGLNLTAFNETNTSFSAQSEGDFLYGCSYWDFEFGICLTDWIYLFDINNSENYTADLAREVMAFAEGVFELEDIEEDLEIESEEEIEVGKEDFLVNLLDIMNVSDYTINSFDSGCEDTCKLKNVLSNNFILKFYIKDSVLDLSLIKSEYESLEGVNYSLSFNDGQGKIILGVEHIQPEIIVETLINVTNTTTIVSTVGNVTEETIQYGAIIGQPVKWKKKIMLDAAKEKVEFELPDVAENITLNKIVNGKTAPIVSASLDEGNGTIINLTGDSSEGFTKGILNSITGNSITGMVVSEVPLIETLPLQETIVNDSNLSAEVDIVKVDDLVETVEIEYETPGPTLEVENISEGVRVVLKSDLTYENVLSFVNIPESEADKVNLYRIILDTFTGKEIKQKHNFSLKDNNQDGLVDYVEWVVPLLENNETYEIIVITNALHLDVNRTFMSDIYSNVSKLDGIWSETINDGEYVRVTFEKNLRSDNDITIYPQIIEGSPKIEIYTVDGKEIIAEFVAIRNDEFNKVYLSGLAGVQDTFDLKIIDGKVKFDYIVDPSGTSDFTIQRGSLIMGSASLTGILTEGVDFNQCTGSCFIKQVSSRNNAVGSTSGGGNQNVDDYTTYISDDTGLTAGSGTITFTRRGSATNNRISWEIWEYSGTIGDPNEMDVIDTGTCSFGTSSLTCDGAIIAPTDDADVVVFLTGASNSDVGRNDHQSCMVTSAWVAVSDLPRCTRGESASDNCDISYAIVEYKGSNWNVQRVAHAFNASAIQYDTITDVGAISRAFFHTQQRNEAGNNYDGLIQGGAEVELTATNTVTYSLPRGTTNWGSNMNAVTWVISNTQTENYPMKVTHYNPTARPTGGEEEDNWQVTLTGLTYGLGETSIAGVSSQSGGTGTAWPRGYVAVQLTDTSTANLWQSDSGQIQDYTFQTIEWPAYSGGGESSNVTVNETVVDGNGVPVNVSLEINSDGGGNVYSQNGTIHNLSLSSGIYDIILKPIDGTIKQILFEDYNMSNGVNQIIDLDKAVPIDKFQKTFAINPKLQNFVNATVTVTATSNTLYKCADWNYTDQSCGGSWTLLKEGMIPGQDYNITITPNDPGFGEINITAAQHLDENYSFISDVYNQTNALDGNWTEMINNTEIVRVTFEQNLTPAHHIKIYVRNNQSANTHVKVYEENTSNLITTFDNISSEGYYKAYLTAMSGENDTFDLKVINDDGLNTAFLEFDHIIDPNEIPNVTITAPANTTNHDSGTAGVELNVTVVDDLLPVDNVTLKIYASNDSNPELDDLVYKANVTNGTKVSYNFSKRPFDIVSDTLFGFHFDQILSKGESSTKVYDWADVKNGTPGGDAAVDYSNDIFGGNFEFDGTGDWVTVAPGYTEIQHRWNLTIMGWLRSDDITQSRMFAAQGVFDPAGAPGQYVGFFVGQNGKNMAVIQGNGASDTTSLTPGFFLNNGEWVHMAITRFQNGSYAVYRNGVLNNTFTNTHAIYTAAILNFRIGASNSNNGGNPLPWNGGIDDFIVINRTLTSEEINQTLKLTDTTYYWNASGDDSQLVNNSDLFQFDIGAVVTNTHPNATVIAPINTTNYTDVGEILLNSTVLDAEDPLMFVKIYGSSGQTKSDVSYSDMLYQNISWQNNTYLTYNWTAPVLVPDSNYLLLAHFDNNTKYGENSTHVFDFADSDGVQNGTMGGAARINKTGGRLGGTFFSTATSIDNLVNFGDQDNWVSENNISYSFWAKPRILSDTRGIFDKRAAVSSGFAIRQVGDDFGLKIEGSTPIIDGVFQKDEWTHIVVSFNESDQVTIYIDGVFNSTFTVPSMPNNNAAVLIGVGRTAVGLIDYEFNGSIDEFAILNKSLNASEVLDMYRLPSGDHSWFVEVDDYDTEEYVPKLSNESDSWMFTIDRKPEINSLSIGPTGVNRTTGINCTFTPLDDWDSTLDVTIKYYNGTDLFATKTPTGLTSGYPYTDNLSAFTYNHFENYSCNITTTDTRSSVSDQENSSYIFIENYEPGTAVLNGPDETITYTNRTPTFNWTPSDIFDRLPSVSNTSCVSEGNFFCQGRTSDPDQDQVNHTLNISCFVVAGGTCDDEREYLVVENSTNCDANANGYLDNEDNCTFTLPTELTRFYDDNNFYRWTVKSEDPYVQEEDLPTVFNYNLSTYIALDILDQVVDFGSLGVGVRSETSGCDLSTQTPTPCPIWIENSGNVLADVNITGPTVAFWDTQSLPHSIDYFSVKVGDGTEGSSFDSADSNITYRIMPASGVTEKFINNLSKDDSSDEARIDFNISVPVGELAGAKGMILELTTWYGEINGG